LIRAFLAGLLAAISLAPIVPARAQDRDLGAAVSPLRLVARGGAPISVTGLHSFFDTVELTAASDGLAVSNRLPLERYVLGLNEVPTDWPEEALKAQAVAARTYALNDLEDGRTGDAAVYGYDICATVLCQVFSGADVVRAENGERWTAAVEATAGETILYDGDPILARYHSTSGGRTMDNEDAFPGEPAYPYLKSVPSDTEQGSPLARWKVTFKIGEVQAMLVRAGWWTGSQRLLRVRSAGGPFYNPNVAFEGEGGRRLVRTADEFRDIARDLAPAMFPGRYPSRWNTSSGVLPETLPSERYRVTTTGKTVVFDGTGWGHGSGMSQWGAHGLAQQGATYTDILTHYYTGVSVGDYPDPGVIEVGVEQARSSVSASGSFKIVDGRGKTIVREALGTWNFVWGGAGAVSIQPPQGYGLPLEVGIVNAPKKVLVGESAFITVALSRPARINTQTERSPTGYRDPGVEVKDAGRRRVVWLAPLEEGSYRVRVQARAGPSRERSEPVKIVVTSSKVKGDPEDPAEATTDRGPRDDDSPPVLVLAIFGAFLVLGLGAVVRARSGSATD
jgi:stage II sporulation protein D